jgi:hypothetical protein
LSFAVSSTLPIDSKLISVTLNGAAPTNMIVSGQPNNLTVTIHGLQTNTTYQTIIGVNTTNNDPAVASYTFDTYSLTNYTWECEDWDYSSGQYFDNPPPGAYANLSGVDGIDAHNLDTGNNSAYRTEDTGNLGNEVNGDAKRRQYVTASTNDFDIGWTATGQWANYTRSYPAGSYNVFMRAASPSGQKDGASLWRQTISGATTNLVQLGVFNMLNTGGYQTYAYVPMTDTNGNVVTISTTGAPTTFRLNEDNGGWNGNFFMLLPAQAGPAKVTLSITRSASSVTISWTPSGGTLQSSQALGANASWQPVTGATNPMTVPVGNNPAFYRIK